MLRAVEADEKNPAPASQRWTRAAIAVSSIWPVASAAAKTDPSAGADPSVHERFIRRVTDRHGEVLIADVVLGNPPEEEFGSEFVDSTGSELPPELTALPPQMRQALEQQIRQIRAIEQPEQLEQVLGAMDAQAGQVPEEMKPAFEYMKKVIGERLAELAGSEGGR